MEHKSENVHPHWKASESDFVVLKPHKELVRNAIAYAIASEMDLDAEQ